MNISLRCMNSEIYIPLTFLAEINTAGKYITDAPTCLEMNTLWTKNHIYSHHNNSLFSSPALSGCTCGLFILVGTWENARINTSCGFLLPCVDVSFSYSPNVLCVWSLGIIKKKKREKKNCISTLLRLEK